MNEEKSKLQLIGEIAEANNKNLDLIEEINRLNKSLDVATEMINNKQEEIVRLNNIINEFEKWLNELGAWCYLDKLKELKENK